ncbi:hypothetical protein M430DRAFT_32711 [Amorphotheca resinae ATCC 22711]|uniref:CTCK domain-containing protein n=1 Tax=Amorphotheca resinae ATCC 22711 TaxID=857342 RepID=A0A2T3BG16_AMORE|nr:hypothetical protein M430DRAFT_32711 [Amorphotheca resinae ATCC 22711]PSS28278.1 hypothetical protein M430DRAFT_32711 [Amorphotheca resinae ATCC 22711]
MVALTRSFLTTILSILLFSSASIQSDDARGTVSPPAIEEQLQSLSLSQINTNNSPIHLHQIGQCPTSPKPVCSDPNCQGPRYICPMQFQCEATTAFHMNGRDVTITGCRCCPLPIYVWCENLDCRAPAGTRQCASDELGGCACDTADDRKERFHREFRVEDIPVLAEGEVEEDLIEVNDDGLLDIDSMTQTRPVTARPDGSTRLSQSVQEQERRRTGAMVLPTLGSDQQQFRVTRDAQIDVLASF